MTKPRRYTCGTCGKQATAAEMIFSRHTGGRYCSDLRACLKRRKRRPKAAA